MGMGKVPLRSLSQDAQRGYIPREFHAKRTSKGLQNSTSSGKGQPNLKFEINISRVKVLEIKAAISSWM